MNRAKCGHPGIFNITCWRMFKPHLLYHSRCNLDRRLLDKCATAFLKEPLNYQCIGPSFALKGRREALTGSSAATAHQGAGAMIVLCLVVLAVAVFYIIFW